MKLIVLLLCCVCGNHGVEDRIDIPFNIVIIDAKPICQKQQDVVIKEGRTVRLYAKLQYLDGIHRAHCEYNNGTGFRELAETYYKEQSHDAWYLDVKNIKKDKFGDWRCKLHFNKFNDHGLKQVEGVYSVVNCTVRVKGDDSGDRLRCSKEGTLKTDFGHSLHSQFK